MAYAAWVSCFINLGFIILYFTILFLLQFLRHRIGVTHCSSFGLTFITSVQIHLQHHFMAPLPLHRTLSPERHRIFVISLDIKYDMIIDCVTV